MTQPRTMLVRPSNAAAPANQSGSTAERSPLASLAPRDAPLPTDEAQRAPNDDGTARGDAPALARNAEQPLRGVRVVLAEDGPDNQRLLGFFLSRAGAEVRTFENGKLALMAIRASVNPVECDLVITDMQMPIMDGYAFARELRAGGWHGPILALTANAMQGDDRACLDAGCDRYLAKPVAATELINACRELVTGVSRDGVQAA